MNPSPPFSAAPRRVSRRVFWIAACLAAMLAAGPAAACDDVWITLGADAFASASSLFVSGAEGKPLPRLSEAKGVVLTHVPRSGLDALSARLHGDFRRCGGFIAHESLEEGLAELARVSSASLTVGGAGFTIDQPQWVQQVAGAVEEALLNKC
jgi:leucyl aminopeptidase